MKKARGGMMLGIVMGSILLAGCFGERHLQSDAVGPTKVEAEQLAQGILDQKAAALDVNGDHYVLKGKPHYKAKPLGEQGGGVLYEVQATETVKKVK